MATSERAKQTVVGNRQSEVRQNRHPAGPKHFYLQYNKKALVNKLAKRKIDGLSIKPGPTQSGILVGTQDHYPVGGEVTGINAISVFLSTYWPLIVILLIPIGLFLYKKRSAIPQWFIRLMYLFKRT